ncbi:hypothetical protein G9F71_004425 [Clostridium sp. FP2]|nr:hypothetical protein [Clostridium sp. FP2]MBZ9622105.1 hypothetical protein [Clostridium sp. FP2]
MYYGESDRVAASFGSLSQDGGENRLNVAISRGWNIIRIWSKDWCLN